MTEPKNANTMSKALKRSAKPELVKVGKTEISTHGWRDSLAIDYILRAAVEDNESKQWHPRSVPIAELSRVFYGANTPTGKERVRRRVPGLATKLLMGRNLMLLSETDPKNHHRCTAVKVFDSASDFDKQLLAGKVQSFSKQYRWSADKMEKACAILAQFQTSSDTDAS